MFIDSVNFSTTKGASHLVDISTLSYSDGDLLIIVTTMDIFSGVNQWGGMDNGWLTKEEEFGNANIQQATYYKFASGVEPNPTITTHPNGALSGIVASFSGVDATTPFDVDPAPWVENFSLAITSPFITTLTDNAIWIAWTCQDLGSNTLSLNGGSMTFVSSSASSSTVTALAYKEVTTAGLTGTQDWTAVGAPEDLRTTSFALKAAATPPTGSSSRVSTWTEKTVLDGGEYIAAESGTDFRAIKTSTIASYISGGAINLSGVAGFDNTGVTAQNTVLETAMASGKPVLISDGDYFIEGVGDGVEIPAALGCNLVPLGDNVRFVFEAGVAIAALFYDGTRNLTANIPVNLVAGEVDWPIVNKNALTRITATTPGAFAGFGEGDVGYITSDDLDEAGFVKGESFSVVFATNDYVITDRILYETYDAATNTTAVRFMQSKPQVRIHPGITFVPADDVTQDPIPRSISCRIICAYDPQIHVDLDNVYNFGVQLEGTYLGNIHVNCKNLFVDYDIGAFGYGVWASGPAWNTNITAKGVKSGHLTVIGGTGTAYNSFFNGRYGAPLDCRTDADSTNARNAAADCHWGKRCIIKSRTRAGFYDGVTTSSTFNVSGAAVHGKELIVTVDAIDCHQAVELRENVAPNTYTFKDCTYSGTTARFLDFMRIPTLAAPATIIIEGGKIDIPAGNYRVFETIGTSGPVDVIVNGLVAVNPLELYNLNQSGDLNSLTILDMTVFAGTATQQQMVTFGQNSTDKVQIWNMKVVNNPGNGHPLGIGHAATGITASVRVGTIQSTSAIADASPGNLGTFTKNALNTA